MAGGVDSAGSVVVVFAAGLSGSITPSRVGLLSVLAGAGDRHQSVACRDSAVGR